MFEYNENACKVVITFHEGHLEHIKKQLEFLRREQGLASEPALFHAIAEAILRVEFDKNASEMKIAEMKQLLSSIN